MSFTYTSGATDTPYTITFHENTECDILVGGGGGAGGKFGGGGGAGSVLFTSQIVLNGAISIQVGRGGVGSTSFNANGENGLQSNITINGITYIADGTGFLNYTNANGWLLSQVSAGTSAPFYKY